MLSPLTLILTPRSSFPDRRALPDHFSCRTVRMSPTTIPRPRPLFKRFRQKIRQNALRYCGNVSTAHSIFCRMIPSLTYISMWFSKQPRHSRIFSPGCCFLENFFYKIYDIISIPKMIIYKINPGFRYTYFLYGVGHPFWRPICHQ